MSKTSKPMKLWKKLLLGAAAVVVLAVAGVAAYTANYVGDVMDEMKPESGAASIEEQYKTPPEYEGDVVNVLVCGIDSSEDRDYDGDGMTDLILYVQFDVANKKISMFQIPRDTFVGGYKLTMENGEVYRSSNGKINSVMRRNATTNAAGEEVGNLNALAAVIYNMYKLPVDHYVTIDMDALVDMVDHMQGIDVYIPERIEKKTAAGSSVLEAGYHTLLGSDVQFLVRYRGYSNSDLGRLGMQRYIYQGLFTKLRSCTVTDLVRLMPVVAQYVKTDLDMTTIIQLAIAALSVNSSDFMLCTSPVYMGCDLFDAETDPETGKVTGQSIVLADRDKNAQLLNEYFRTYTGEVPAEELNLPDWPHSGGSTDISIQYMSGLDQQVNDAIDAGNTDIEGAEKIEGSEAASSQAASSAAAASSDAAA